MNRIWRVALVTGAAVALASGCSDSSAGTPTPTGAESPTDGNPTETSVPARPHELRLDGKDPCALVPESDWPRFFIKKPGKPKQNETYKSPECFYGTNVGAFAVTLVMTEGVEVWHEGKRRAQPADVAPVAGFPAITLTLPADKNRCDVAVDVANGQYLLAVVDIDNSSLSEVPERCEYAHQLAESAMNTLVA